MSHSLPEPNGRYLPANGRVLYTFSPSQRSEHAAADDPANGGLLGYWNTLRQRKWTIALVTLAFGLLGLLASLAQEPVYQARATLEVQERNPDFLDMRRVNPIDQPSGSIQDVGLQTQLDIIRSQAMLGRALDEIGDANLEPLRQPGPVGRLRGLLGLAGEEEPSRAKLLERAASDLTLRGSGETRIVQILYDSTDPDFAATFANTLAEGFIRFSLESNWQTTQETGEWLERQLLEMETELKQLEAKLQEYAREAGLMYTSEEGSLAEEKLRQLQAALSEAQGARIEKQSRRELIESSSPESLPNVLDDETLRQYQTELTQLRREEAELRTTYTPENARVRKVRAQVETLETALAKMRETILQRIKNEYTETSRRERLLQADYDAQASQVNDQSQRAIQYNILKRDVDSSREIYQAMLQRVKESRMASALPSSNVRVLDRALVPEEPYRPSRALNLQLGLIFGLFLVTAFVLFTETADRTLRHPGDVTSYLEMPELGVIPAAVNGQRTGNVNSLVTVNHIGGLLPAARPAHLETLSWQQEPSLLTESFRATCASILFSTQNGFQPRRIVVSSANPGEGKTTVATNLAVALAGLNRTVLLIDADLRKPQVHKVFGIPQCSGLTELLRAEDQINNPRLHQSVYLLPIENLCVLPSGAIATDSASLLLSKTMEKILEKFEREFDFVLLDSPPINQLPDARILGRIADGVILVIRAGVTTRHVAASARQRLERDGARVLGSVLNNWDPKASNRYGDSYDVDKDYYAHPSS